MAVVGGDVEHLHLQCALHQESLFRDAYLIQLHLAAAVTDLENLREIMAVTEMYVS